MAKLLINDQNKVLVGSNGKAYAVRNLDVLKGSTSPVDFTAAAGRILRLMRYGKCEQSGTPTPSAPVDILCNNGAIKAKHQSGLPLGYQKLDYVAGKTGQTVVNTGVSGSLANLRIVLRAKKTSHSAYSSFFGNYVDENTNCTRIIEGGAASSPVLFTYNGKAGGGSASASDVFSGDAHTYDLSSSGLVVDGDKSFANRKVSGTSNSTNIAICNPKVTETPASSGVSTVFAYFKIYQGETLIRDYIPVKRLSDDKVGFYELVNGTFEQGIFASSYAFAAGSPVDDPVELYADGTPEVLTVRGKNLINPDAAGVVNGSYITDAGNQASDNLSFLSDYILVAEGETYTAQGYRSSGTATANMRVHGFDASKTWNRMLAKEPMLPGEVTSATFVIPSGVKYVRVCGYIGYRSGRDAMLELGNTATVYEPYTEQTASVPMLLGVGNYKDEAELISGIKTGKVGIKVFDGTETITRSPSGAMITTIDGVAIGANNTPMNTHFALETSPTSVAVGTQRFGANGTKIYSTNYYMKHATITTVADFKSWLATQYAAGTPVIVIYPLAPPTTENVTPQPLNTGTGTNTLTDTAEVSNPEYNLTYKIQWQST